MKKNLKFFIPLVVIILAALIYFLVLNPTTRLINRLRVTSFDNRFLFQSEVGNLLVEVLDDDLVHFELVSSEYSSDVEKPIFSTIMVDKTDYTGAESIDFNGRNTIQTQEIKIQVNTDDLCITITDLSKEPDLILTTLCPDRLDQSAKRFTFTPESFTNAYGLGEKFLYAGISDGDWVGEIRSSGDYGNVQEGFNNGAVGDDQFPVLYLAGEGYDSYALFLDNPYKQYWDLAGSPWRVIVGGDAIRFYVLTGPDLQDLRKDFMELVGKPLVLPKPAFGLWISEYGFDNWEELEDKLTTLRENQFPVDGFVLDGQWYGGIVAETDDTPVGSLTWDAENFPDAESVISNLKEKEGVRLIAIEQPYIGKNLAEHKEMADAGYLVEQCEDCDPVYLTSNPWWGKGGMIDFTDSAGSVFWHDTKREALIADGLLGHWTDLGEPELYDKNGYYAGVLDGDYLKHDHASIHNLYNLLWSKSIYDGYVRNEHSERTFILSRSGTVGSQRYGVAMWSGDISSLLSSLKTHLNVQMHMSFSGIDYYGADIGGFWRQEGDLTDIYTQWFADGVAFDIPARTHTFNLCNCNETAPDRIGDVASNLQNIRLRYSLIPYLYSLAHRANLYGEPIIAPMVYYFQEDEAVREMGDQKMVGSFVLVKAVAEDGIRETPVYLPAGTWQNMHTGTWIESSGEWTSSISLYPEDLFTLPVFLRAGAIIPRMYVDEMTMNSSGMRTDGSRHDELLLDVVASESPTEFTLFEDDGLTTAYQNGEMKTTVITQQLTGNTEFISIAAAQGAYEGEIAERNNIIRLYIQNSGAVSVLLNGSELDEMTSLEKFDAAESGWFNTDNSILIKTGILSTSQEKNLEINLSVN